MTILVMTTLIIGIISGYFILPSYILRHLDIVSTIALNLLILSIGIDLGHNKEVFIRIKKKGLKIFIIPLSIISGSIAGSILASLIYQISLNLGLAIGAGFGWYSLSGVILEHIAGAEAGAVAFLTNIFREVIAVVTIPYLVKYFNKYTAIAPAGATSMDTTLPIVAQYTDDEVAAISFINGMLLSILVPVLVPLFFSF